jgi:hypothetical protein
MAYVSVPSTSKGPWTVETVVENGFGLTITCKCGHEARWTCKETFLRAKGAVEVDLRTFATRLKCVCGDPRLTVGWWRDIRAWGGVKPSSTYAARVAEWSGE